MNKTNKNKIKGFRIFNIITSAYLTFVNIMPITSLSYMKTKQSDIPFGFIESNSVSRLSSEKPKELNGYLGWDKKLKFMDFYELGNYFMDSYESAKRLEREKDIDLSIRMNELHIEAIKCIENLMCKKEYGAAHHLIIRVLLNYPRDVDIEKRFNMSAASVYMLLGKELEEKKDYNNSKLAFAYASLYFRNAGEKELREIAINEMERIYELIRYSE
ncbi:hypothetical protein KO317_02550 [Candidatus Micrarchaeota archaeon]|nr:hypothetical protein [Candidatus Micrarchaeota archaeon]